MAVKELRSNVIDSKDRIIKKISSENTQLREQISRFLERIRENEAIWSHFSDIEDIIVSSRYLLDMAEKVISELKARFSLDAVTIILTSDSEGTVEQSIFPRLMKKDVDNIYSAGKAAILERLVLAGKPVLTNEWTQDLGAFFFPGADSIRSAAILPLQLWGELLGTLNLGSRDVNRYYPGADTSFLERLSTKMAIGVSNSISHERLEKLAVTDPLTGLHNRRSMEEAAQTEFDRAARYSTTCSFIMIDLDGFKAVNDEYGHETGDRILKACASVMKARLRVTDTCARYGGDEFCIILPETSCQGAVSTANKLLKLFQELTVASPGGPLSVQASFGVADNLKEKYESWEDIVKEADRRLYKAKKRGGGTVEPKDMKE